MPGEHFAARPMTGTGPAARVDPLLAATDPALPHRAGDPGASQPAEERTPVPWTRPAAAPEPATPVAQSAATAAPPLTREPAPHPAASAAPHAEPAERGAATAPAFHREPASHSERVRGAPVAPPFTREPAPHQEPVERGASTAPQLRRFIKSRAYVPMHELRRRFGINGNDDDVTPIELERGRIFVGLPGPEGRLLGELLRSGDIGYELSMDPMSPIVIGVYPMRPVPRP
ncbi:MAG TPA: hypothetical protein VEX41_07080 [Candidatus Eisenbacteria bacterium]|nr:hypothetical protein [Candidatus Eisenbacteria bacterium]